MADANGAAPGCGPQDRAPRDAQPRDCPPPDRRPPDRRPPDHRVEDHAPVERAPEDRAPADPAPEDRAPEDPAPADRAPEDPAPADPAPEDRAPADPAPEDRASADRSVYDALDPRAREVLECWFGAPDAPDFGKARKRWFSADDAFDAMLRERFGALIDAALDSRLDSWAATPLGALALVIVLDQFSRNCHRDTARAFAADRKALQIARQMVESGADRLLPGVHHRAFAYLPFEHDEALASQRESLRLFKALAEEPGGESYYPFAVRHADIIERFGRFPHRNALLGRESTAGEIAFLREPGSSFQSRARKRSRSA